MDNHRRIVLTIVFAFLSIFVQSASPKQDQTIPPQRRMRYTSRSTDDAKSWQKDVRAKLSQLLRINDLIQKRDAIPLRAKELSSVDRETYYVKEVEISSTSSRRIRVLVTIPNSIESTVPAVVCIGGHGSNLYSPYDPKTIAGEALRIKKDSIYKGFGTVLAKKGYVTISTTVSQHNVYEEGRLPLAPGDSPKSGIILDYKFPTVVNNPVCLFRDILDISSRHFQISVP